MSDIAIFRQGASYRIGQSQICRRQFYRIVDTVTGEFTRVGGSTILRSLPRAIAVVRNSDRLIIEEFFAWCDADSDDRQRPEEVEELASLVCQRVDVKQDGGSPCDAGESVNMDTGNSPRP